jgi:glucan 1,3-beta-glucosidase
MITQNGNTLALYSDNVNVYPDTIALFTTGVAPCTTSLIGWNYRGCYTDNPSARALGNRLYPPGSTAAMTIEACITVCQAAGYSLAGVEYAGECCKFPFLVLLHLHVVGDFF